MPPDTGNMPVYKLYAYTLCQIWWQEPELPSEEGWRKWY